jgi:hypothetical protein
MGGRVLRLAAEGDGNPDGSEYGMLTAAACRTKADECRVLAARPGTSRRRASLLIAMSRSYAALGGQIERLEEIDREERNGN